MGRGNSALLSEGTLHVANLKSGKWIPVTIEAVTKAFANEKFKNPAGVSGKREELQKKFQNQGDVVTYCHEAAVILGGMPTDRPEDIEISPFDNTVFICHTNNDAHGNIHGHITRIFEKDNDLGAQSLTLRSLPQEAANPASVHLTIWHSIRMEIYGLLPTFPPAA